MRVLIVRPPLLATGLTNTPLGHEQALSPDQAAATIVANLLEPRDDRRGAQLLDDFAPPPQNAK